MLSCFVPVGVAKDRRQLSGLSSRPAANTNTCPVCPDTGLTVLSLQRSSQQPTTCLVCALVPCELMSGLWCMASTASACVPAESLKTESQASSMKCLQQQDGVHSDICCCSQFICSLKSEKEASMCERSKCKVVCLKSCLSVKGIAKTLQDEVPIVDCRYAHLALFVRERDANGPDGSTMAMRAHDNKTFQLVFARTSRLRVAAAGATQANRHPTRQQMGRRRQASTQTRFLWCYCRLSDSFGKADR